MVGRSEAFPIVGAISGMIRSATRAKSELKIAVQDVGKVKDSSPVLPICIVVGVRGSRTSKAMPIDKSCHKSGEMLVKTGHVCEGG